MDAHRSFDAATHSDDGCSLPGAGRSHTVLRGPQHEDRLVAANGTAGGTGPSLPLAVLDSLQAAIALLDVDGTIVLVNEPWRAFAAVNGPTTPGCGVGTSYLESCEAAGDPEGSKAAEGIRRVLDGSLPAFDFEYACDRQGEQRWFQLKVRPLAGTATAAASRAGAVVTHAEITERRRVAAELARDVTSRKRTEEALHESVTEFRSLTAALPQIVWTSVEGNLVTLNARWTEYTGRSLADGLGRDWLEQVHPDDRTRVQEAAHSWDERGLESSVELRLAAADRSYRWWLLRGVPLKDEAGRVVRCLGTFTDVDDLKRAEAEVLRANRELQRQRTELRTLFDLVPAMVWFKDTNGRVLQVNQRAADAMGLSVDASLGLQISDLYPDSAGRYSLEDRQTIRTGKPLLGIIEQVEKAGGERVWVQSDKVPYRDENGEIIGLIVMKHDITARKEAEDALTELNATLEARVQRRTEELAHAREEAERADKAKSSFLATMSHEIRTPMTGMLGLLELLELTPLDQEQSCTLAVVRDSGQALQRIIDGILDFSKIEADSLALDIAPASIRDVVANVCSLYGPAASAKGLQLQGNVDPAVSQYVQFDAVRLGQILNNFISNAIKFTERGTVDVGVELESRTTVQETLRITVRDTGIGIPRQKVGGLFQPFAQADAHTGTEFGGTGLGLFIARRLAELMGGEITLDSEPGRGTSLTLRAAFPTCAGDVQAHPPDAGRERLNALVARRPVAPGIEEAARRGTLLLVVDDHPTNRMVLLRQAAILGYAAEAAADGEEALAKWAPGRFGAVLTDCNMPRMNGFRLAAAIREMEANSGVRTPIIGCTANAMAEAEGDCLAAGMDDRVTKPVALADLFAKLHHWLPLGAEAASAPAADFRAAEARVERSQAGMPDGAWLAMVAGGEGAVPEVIADFRRCNDADASQLRQACSSGDLHAIGQIAHRIAGACAMLGAVRLGDASHAVQVAASADIHQVAAAMTTFEHEFAQLTEYLDFHWK